MKCDKQHCPPFAFSGRVIRQKPIWPEQPWRAGRAWLRGSPPGSEAPPPSQPRFPPNGHPPPQQGSFGYPPNPTPAAGTSHQNKRKPTGPIPQIPLRRPHVVVPVIPSHKRPQGGQSRPRPPTDNPAGPSQDGQSRPRPPTENPAGPSQGGQSRPRPPTENPAGPSQGGQSPPSHPQSGGSLRRGVSPALPPAIRRVLRRGVSPRPPTGNPAGSFAGGAVPPSHRQSGGSFAGGKKKKKAHRWAIPKKDVPEEGKGVQGWTRVRVQAQNHQPGP
ncbi:hypothetical protein C8F04DRAFT_1202467 [Mycena alexandri]|uniref:Uncharacterized protein n=1 Tax=Mycena alexandri TaxID=1745969 RepID=A0AAD6WL66_9AGAR|nr:hypothetical protein C8F04DRAFT_1202467 [Mycena alexandri]